MEEASLGNHSQRAELRLVSYVPNAFASEEGSGPGDQLLLFNAPSELTICMHDIRKAEEKAEPCSPP